MPKDLSALFSPKSVCVIGASRSPEKVGEIILKNIINSKFTGKIYPVNPNIETINDLKCSSELARKTFPVPGMVRIEIPSSSSAYLL